ncbi:hypothetical protein H2201_006840 [Coniosporium apollinis]|uniref:DUF6594 domain-containing protein n=1 Tax=Coniosporium apollinis TaxID=61459 RepID=A0ABQ9NSA4_9PEZI|nr:hypothetical protein H2201_006840 [Coniosporium apollinis]
MGGGGAADKTVEFADGTSKDVELGDSKPISPVSPSNVCPGYPRLAHWAEIAHLEEELHELERLNADGCASILTHVQGLMSAPEGSSGWKQLQKMLEIRGKLKEYNRIAWLKGPKDVWELDEDCSTIQHDLVALAQRDVASDHFTSWVIDWLVVHYAKLKHRFSRNKGEFTEIDDRKINRAVGTFTTIFGSLLPTASVFALYYIHSTVWRLTFIMLFSCFFSTCLAVFTDARRIETFAGAVALASVQVVFISTTDGSSYTEGRS